MRDPNLPLVEDVRKLLSGYKHNEFSFQNLAKDLGKPLDYLIHAFGTESSLVEEILKYEEQNLENIFTEHDFSGSNAIDSLLKVSRAISQKFVNILPSITFDLRTLFPDVRQKFVDRRIQFVSAKIRSNFEQGMSQGLYRPDFSSELVARIYMSRLIDIHNPDFFPNESISFDLLFDVMFDTFIRGICSETGRNYYESQIKTMRLEGVAVRG